MTEPRWSHRGGETVKPTLMALASLFADQSTEDSIKPNIILMMTDDTGFSCISPYGSEIQTPNLQKLVDGGCASRSCYNNAKCTTTNARGRRDLG